MLAGSDRRRAKQKHRSMCQDLSLSNAAAVDSRDLLSQPGSAVHSSFRIQDGDQRVENMGILDGKTQDYAFTHEKGKRERVEKDNEMRWRQATMVPFLNQ